MVDTDVPQRFECISPRICTQIIAPVISATIALPFAPSADPELCSWTSDMFFLNCCTTTSISVAPREHIDPKVPWSGFNLFFRGLRRKSKIARDERCLGPPCTSAHVHVSVRPILAKECGDPFNILIKLLSSYRGSLPGPIL